MASPCCIHSAPSGMETPGSPPGACGVTAAPPPAAALSAKPDTLKSTLLSFTYLRARAASAAGARLGARRARGSCALPDRLPDHVHSARHSGTD